MAPITNYAHAAKWTDGNLYRWWNDGNDRLIIERNGVPRAFKVKPSNDYAYDIKKTHINSTIGAPGLVELIADCWSERGIWNTVYPAALLVTAYDTVKPTSY